MIKTAPYPADMTLASLSRAEERIETTVEPELYAMPATPGQVRFWSLDQLSSGNPALNMPLMWQCDGDLNVSAMVQAFSLCVRRHETLRTTFQLMEGAALSDHPSARCRSTAARRSERVAR